MGLGLRRPFYRPKLVPKSLPGGSLEGPGRVLGGSLEGPGRVLGGSREGPGRVPGGSQAGPGGVPSHVRQKGAVGSKRVAPFWHLNGSEEALLEAPGGPKWPPKWAKIAPKRRPKTIIN